MKFEELISEIQQLPSDQRLRLLSVIQESLQTEESEHPYSLLDLEGVGESLWRGIDAQDYVNKLRDEWDS
jgi:hypothetical protein